MLMRTASVMVVFTIIAQSGARGADEPAVHQITVHPGAVPAAALRYRLMPEPAELTAGNAATIYMSALLLAPKLDEAQQQQLDTWNDAPLDQLPREEIRKFLQDSYKPAFGQLEIAARRDYCNWDTSWREQSFMALLPHLNGLRQVTNALALRAKLEIAEGRFDDAARTLATGFAMASAIKGDSKIAAAWVGEGSTAGVSVGLGSMTGSGEPTAVGVEVDVAVAVDVGCSAAAAAAVTVK